jgi:ELWxxDGT repeat protein
MKRTWISMVLGMIGAALSAQVTIVEEEPMTPDQMRTVDSGMLFFRETASFYDHELWITDGTPGGAHRVKDINPDSDDDLYDGFNACGVDPYSTYVYDGSMYFLANDGTHGIEIWKSDGTEAGTVMLHDIVPGGAGWNFTSCHYPRFAAYNGLLYFSASANGTDYELWRTDGTDGGTALFKDIYPGTIGSDPHFLTVYNGKLYFTARDDVHGWELFTSDGTAAGTHVLKDIVPGIGGAMNDGYDGSIPPFMTVSGGYLYFLAGDGTFSGNFHLWRTDGTEAGTIQLETSLAPGAWWGSGESYSADASGQFLFQADGGVQESHLWKSDGTLAGTQMVPTNNDLHAWKDFRSYGNAVYFLGDENNHKGLCKSDGTTAGTYLVHQFNTTGETDQFRYYTELDGYLFFEAIFTLPGTSMTDWRVVQTNGTDQGTYVFHGVRPIGPLTQLGNDLLFSGYDTVTYQQRSLYRLHPLSVGIEEATQVPRLQVAPNPASSAVEIWDDDLAREAADLYVIGGLGKVVMHGHLPLGAAKRTLTLPPDLADGVYLLRLQTAASVEQARLVVQR